MKTYNVKAQASIYSKSGSKWDCMGNESFQKIILAVFIGKKNFEGKTAIKDGQTYKLKDKFIYGSAV